MGKKRKRSGLTPEDIQQIVGAVRGTEVDVAPVLSPQEGAVPAASLSSSVVSAPASASAGVPVSASAVPPATAPVSAGMPIDASVTVTGASTGASLSQVPSPEAQQQQTQDVHQSDASSQAPSIPQVQPLNEQPLAQSHRQPAASPLPQQQATSQPHQVLQEYAIPVVPQSQQPSQEQAAYQARTSYQQQASPQASFIPQVNPSQAQTQPQQPPQVVVQMPKRSKAPWIILLVIVLLFAAYFAARSFLHYDVLAELGLTSSGDSVAIPENSVALIRLEGSIDASDSSSITPEDIYAQLKEAEQNPRVKALVLRVNSGGGSAAASQEMAAYVAACTKPVVVSCADACASGAYWVASQADCIVALPASSVGSIGVIITITDLTELLGGLGVNIESIHSGEDKGMGAYYESLTDEQRALLQREVDQISEQFIQAVATGRGMDADAVRALATGQSYTGADGVENGLVDMTGTLVDACDKAAELAGIGASYETVEFGRSTTISARDLLGLLG